MSFHVVLVEPDIAQNVGGIARLCVATGSKLHLVGRLGFHLDDKRVRRAGLDYWQHCDVCRHDTVDDAKRALPGSWHCFSARAKRLYSELAFAADSVLVFGSEERGLPASLCTDPEFTLRIPILDSRVRSLNVATSVGIVLYEAVRQNGLGRPHAHA